MNLPLNIDWQQILLHALNFIILSFGLYLLLYKPVKNFMDKRMEYYKGLDENAKLKKLEAEKLQADYEKKLQYAEEEASKIKKEAINAAEEAGQAEIDEARAQAGRILSDATKAAEREKMRILADAQSEITELAAKATEKLLQSKSDINAYDQFLDAAERRSSDEQS